MLLTIVLTCVLMIATAQDTQLNDDIWALYKKKFSKAYTLSEDNSRRIHFYNALVKIQRHNMEEDMGLHGYRQGLTQFTDWTIAEFKAKMSCNLGDRVGSNNGPIYEAPLLDTEQRLPKKVDWRDQGYVTPVKDQAACGSCWAFSATGTVEGQHFAKTKKLVSLSEQNLVDCSTAEGNMGCGGGWPVWALTYILKNNGIDTEKSYPYKGIDQKCKFLNSSIGATITGYKTVTHRSEKMLQNAISTVGPISVCIDAGHESFMNYKSGVYNEARCSSTSLDHCVLAVGYGVDNGNEYYIVKNSWGTGWGMKGYIWMSRNKGNQCGIATKASYPLV